MTDGNVLRETLKHIDESSIRDELGAGEYTVEEQRRLARGPEGLARVLLSVATGTGITLNGSAIDLVDPR